MIHKKTYKKVDKLAAEIVDNVEALKNKYNNMDDGKKKRILMIMGGIVASLAAIGIIKKRRSYRKAAVE